MSKAHKMKQAEKRKAGTLAGIAQAESQAPRGKANGRISAPYRENSARINNILFGIPMPVVKSHKPAANDVKSFNDSIAAQAAAKMVVSPLIAICHKHSCRACSNVWSSFQFYARKVQQDVPGQGQAFFTKRVEDKTEFEQVSETHWVEVAEDHCIQCYQGTGSSVQSQSEPCVNEDFDKMVVKADWTWRKHTPIGEGAYLTPAEHLPAAPADFSACHVTETVALKGRYPTVDGKVAEQNETK